MNNVHSKLSELLSALVIEIECVVLAYRFFGPNFQIFAINKIF